MAAGRIKGITIEIGGDSTKLVSALAKVDNSISKTQSNLRDLNRALKLDPGNTELLKDKQTELGKAIEDTKSKLETEKQALEQMKNTEGFDANSQAARDLKVQIDLDTAALKELETQARQSSSVLGTQMQVAGEKIKAVGDSIKHVGDRIAGIGQSLTTTVTMPIVGAFGASAKAAMDWETAFTGVKKTVDATDAEFEQLATNIKKMATETASSANDIAGVMEIAGQLGIEGVDGLTTFTKTMVELNDTTNLSAEEAATSLARFMNITGENTANASKLGSAIVDLGNNFATSEAEIVSMATKLASAGTIAGLSSTDILALATAMSSVGIEAEAGGTAMSQTLKTISAEFYAFRDGETEGLEYIANVAGMSAKAFADAWEGDPVTAIQAFITGLSRVKDEGDNVFAVLEEMGMKGIRQTNMIQALALASDKLGSAIQTSSRAYEENTALSEEAAKRYETMAAKMSQLKARITEVAVEIGEMLVPYIEKAMTFIEGLVEKWKALDDEQKESILKFAAIAAAIGPVLLVVGKLIASVGSVVSVFGSLVSGGGKLITMISSISGSAGGLSGVLAGLAGPIGIVVAAIAALAAGFAYLYNTNEEFRASIQQVVTTLQTNLAGALERIKPALASLKEAFDGLMEIMAPVFEAIFMFIAGVVSGVASAVGPLIDTITNIILFITNIIQAFFALINGDFEGFFSHLYDALNNWIQGMLSYIEMFIQTVLGFLSVFGIDLQTKFTTMWANVKTAVDTKLGQIKTSIETKWNEIKTWLSETWDAIKEKLIETFEKMRESVEEKVGKVKEAIVEGIEKAVEYIKELPGKFFSWGSDMVQKLIDGIQSKIAAVKAKMSELAGAIRGYIHFSEPDVGPLSDFHTYMPDMINEMVKGINNNIPKVEGAMSNLAAGMLPQMNAGASMMATNNISINVYGAQGQNVSELADIIEERLAENMMRRGAAFG